MIQMQIRFRTPQDAEGSLTVVDASGSAIFAPCRVRAPGLEPDSPPLADQSIAPDTSLSEPYVVKEVVPMAGASVEDIREFGRYGLLVLEQAKDQPDTSLEILLHGGELDAAGQLRPAAKAFRLANSDVHELVQLINRHGKHTVSVLCSNVPLEAAASPDTPGLAQTLLRRFRMLPGWGVAAVPFLAANPAYAYCDPYDSGTSFSSVEFGYLLMNEGGNILNGYVPGNLSGVTIAGGLDLGHQTSAKLLTMGFSQAQVSAWAPYLGTSDSSPLIGASARAALAAHPLTLTEGQARQVNQTYYTYVSNSVGAAYNAAVQAAGVLAGVTFSSLPTAWQTVMADMYLVSPDFVNSACFSQLASGQWSTAITSLQSYAGTTTASKVRAKVNGDRLTNKLAGLPT